MAKLSLQKPKVPVTSGIPVCDWTHFPPTREDAFRLAGYRAAHAMYKGEQGPARYNGTKLFQKILKKVGLVENFPRTISQVSSALLFGRKPTFTVGDDGGPDTEDEGGTDNDGDQETKGDVKSESEAQQILNKIVKLNHFTTTLKESALSQSKCAGAVFRLRWGQPADEDKERVIIEELPADNYFVTTSPHNCREVLSQQIAWVVPQEDSGAGFLYCQEHLVGQVNSSAFWVGAPSGGHYPIQSAVDLSEAYATNPELVPKDVDTHDMPGSLLYYVPNERDCSSYWGDSDYVGLETIFEGINNRISMIDVYLDKHAEPKFLGLPGMRKPDSSVDFAEFGFIEAAQTELMKFLPRYVTWDGQIDGSLKQLEHLLETLCRVARIAPAFFGLDKAGSIESGIAMRMRFFSTTSKIDDKQTYYDPVIKKLLRDALDLHAKHNPGANVAPGEEIEIFWRSGLPIDDTEKTRIVISRIASQTMSRQTGIVHMDGIGRQEALKEMALVQKEMIATAQAQAGIAAGTAQPGQPGQPGQAGAGAANSKNPAIDPLTAQEQSSSGSLPAKVLKASEISPV